MVMYSKGGENQAYIRKAIVALQLMVNIITWLYPRKSKLIVESRYIHGEYAVSNCQGNKGTVIIIIVFHYT